MGFNAFEILPEGLRGITTLQGRLTLAAALRARARSVSHALQRLRFANNRLRIMPQWLGNLTNLNVRPPLPPSLLPLRPLTPSPPQALALQNNCIESLPMSFVNLSNLATLDLGCNKLQGIPPNVLQGGPVGLLQFMRYNYRYDDN